MPVSGLGAELSLDDVTANDFWDPTSDSVQFLNNGGGTRLRADGRTATYTYVNATWAAELSCDAGWYQDVALGEGELLVPEIEDDFSYGVGVVVQTASREAALVFSGAVPKGPQTIFIKNAGVNVVGNPLPIDMTLADIAGNDSWDPTSDNIQFLNAGGGTKIREDGKTATYTYLNSTWAQDMSCEPGWYQDVALGEGEFIAPEADDMIINAGRAFVSQTASTAAGLQFKAAISAE